MSRDGYQRMMVCNRWFLANMAILDIYLKLQRSVNCKKNDDND